MLEAVFSQKNGFDGFVCPSSINQTDQMLVHLQSFNSIPENYTIPESTKNGVPLFYIPPGSTTPVLTLYYLPA